jgi:uncharacterized protein (DUF1778 family)
MPISKQNERVTARVPSHVYDTLTQAAELSGATLNQFLIQAALEKAHAVIEKEHLIHMTMRSAIVFFEAVENPPVPHTRLKSAMKAYKESFSHVEDRDA